MSRIPSFVAGVLASLIAGCASLPSLEGRTATYAFADTAETRLGRAVATGVAANPGKTGIHALAAPHDAFAARVLLAATAEKSLDVQYFIWHADQVGYLMFEAVWQAAERGAALAALVQRGVKVRVLTNSLAASDVKAVHAEYTKRRHDLLRAGVQLYELKPTAAKASDERREGYGASSSGALHAKTFAVDVARIFVGSFNFDPRSARLNTEVGLVIQSTVLAQRLATSFDTEVPMAAYEVRLTPDGSGMEWIEQTASGVKRYDTDPGTSWLLRRQVDFLSILPIEWLL